MFSFAEFFLANRPDWLDGAESVVGGLFHNCLLHGSVSPGKHTQRQFWLQMIDFEKLHMDNNLGQVMRVLQYYDAHGLLQMIPWQWPLINKQFRFSQTLLHEHFFTFLNISTYLAI